MRPSTIALAVLLSFCCGSLALAQNEAAEQFNAAIEKGQQQLADKDFEGAVESFSQAIQLSGGSAGGAYVGRAMARKELEDYAPAQEDIKNALTYSGSDPAITAAAQNLSGEIYMELGAFGDALGDLQSAAEAEPKNPLYQFNLGKVYVMLGGVQEGIDALTKWIEAGVDDPEKNAEAYKLRAQATAQTGKFDDAMSDIAAALAIEPDSHEVYTLKGTILGIEEKYLEAADAYATALKKYKPEEDSELPYIEAHLQRASVLEEAAKRLKDDPNKQKALYQEELDECNTLLENLPDLPTMNGYKAAALFRRGVAQRLLGDLTAAVRSFSEAIDINPSLAQAYFRRGICYFHLGEERMAIDDFDHAASIDYQSPIAALWKGRTYASLGEYYEAIKAYGQALAVSDRYTDAYVNRGLTYLQLGEYDRAVNDFNDAIRLQPTDGEHYYHRGIAYALLGDHKRAIRSLATAIELDPENGPAHLRLANELDAIGKNDLANEYRARGNELGQKRPDGKG